MSKTNAQYEPREQLCRQILPVSAESRGCMRGAGTGDFGGKKASTMACKLQFFSRLLAWLIVTFY